MYQDGLTDVHIDKLRQRINRKEENERVAQREKMRKMESLKKDMKATGSTKTGQLPNNLTFDDNGKPISQQNVNTDKLPNIAGG